MSCLPAVPLAARRAAFVAALFVAAPRLADAQPVPTPPARLDPVAVTATRGAQPVADLLADMTVIGRDEIARAGVQSLAELLQRQPGVEIVRNGGPASVSGVFLRGANSGQTLVLIDGIRLASSTVGTTTFEAIPLDSIERVEILRGPASSLYGADAIGGVVQVFTRRGTGAFGADASAGYGAHATSDLSGGVAGSAGPLRYALHAGTRRSAGFNAVDVPENFSFNPDRDGYRSDDVSVHAAWPWADGQELTAQYWRNRLDAQFDGGPGFDDRTITTVESWQVASRNRLSPVWSMQLGVGEGADDSLSRTAYGSFPFRTVQRQYLWQNDVALPLGMLTAGYERREERVATDAGFAVTVRDTDALFAIYQLRAGPHALQANLRRDDSTQYGGKTTGAMVYGYRIAPKWRVTAGVSTGFKAPSFNDLYYPGFSNAALAPETSRNAEVGVHASGASAGGTWEARAIAYRNRVRDLIVLQCDAAFDCTPQNVARARLTGATLGFDGRFGATSVVASVDLQRPEDEASGHVLPRRARRHGTLAVGHVIGPVRLGMEFVASSSRYDDAANAHPLAGYGVVNLTAEWEVAKGWSAFVRADNVLDRDYRLAADYATGGANLFAGVRWRR